MRSPPLGILFAMLVVPALSAVAASHLHSSPQQSMLDARAAIHIHDTTGPITFNFRSPPLHAPQRARTSAAQLNSRLIAMDFIAAFLTYQLVRVVFRSLSNGALTFVRAHLGATTGRTVPVAEPTPPTTASAIERHARSLGPTAHLETVILPRESPPPVWSAVIEHPRSNCRPDSIPSTAAGPLIEVTSLTHRPDYGGTEFIIQPATAHPTTQHAIASGSSRPESAESPNHGDGGSSTPPRSPSDRLVSAGDDDPWLAGNSADLIAVRSVLALSILAVGRDWAHRSGWHLPGIAHDINWLKWICSGLNPTVTLETLTHGARDIIRSRILNMFQNSCPGTAIVLYFNGHGNSNFMLYDGPDIDAATLIEWIIAIRRATRERLPICIVFDHCRFECSTPPSVNLGRDIYILWACMPGQRCTDFGMDQDPHIPFSNFLKAFSLLVAEAQSSSAGSVGDLMSRLNAWIEVVVRMVCAHDRKRNGCPTLCPLCSCPNFESCTHAETRARHQNALAYPRAQNLDRMLWGFKDGVRGVRTSEVLELLDPAVKSILDPIQKVAEIIKNHEKYKLLTNIAEPPTESPLYVPAGLPVRRGRNTDAAELPSQPLPI